MHPDIQRLQAPIDMQDFRSFPVKGYPRNVMDTDLCIIRLSRLGRISFSRPLINQFNWLKPGNSVRFYSTKKNGLTRWIFGTFKYGLPIHNANVHGTRKISTVYCMQQQLVEAILYSINKPMLNVGETAFIPVVYKDDMAELILGSIEIFGLKESNPYKKFF